MGWIGILTTIFVYYISIKSILILFNNQYLKKQKMAFKMNGSPAKLGTIQGTAGHASALKKKSEETVSKQLVERKKKEYPQYGPESEERKDLAKLMKKREKLAKKEAKLEAKAKKRQKRRDEGKTVFLGNWKKKRNLKRRAKIDKKQAENQTAINKNPAAIVDKQIADDKKKKLPSSPFSPATFDPSIRGKKEKKGFTKTVTDIVRDKEGKRVKPREWDDVREQLEKRRRMRKLKKYAKDYPRDKGKI